jgi:hypothetical protein
MCTAALSISSALVACSGGDVDPSPAAPGQAASATILSSGTWGSDERCEHLTSGLEDASHLFPEYQVNGESHSAAEQLATIREVRNFLETYGHTLHEADQIEALKAAARALGRLGVAIEHAGSAARDSSAVEGKTQTVARRMFFVFATGGCVRM